MLFMKLNNEPKNLNFKLLIKHNIASADDDNNTVKIFDLE